jgi:sterol desaturase/sphingolipid hydroxylase (fatty acid hydroxylase superfamily)
MEAAIKPQNKGTKQLFKSPILEKLSRTHISIPVSIFIVYAVTLFYWSIAHTSISVTSSVSLFGLGFISFTWVEYQIHRHVFHMSTFTRWREGIQYLIHGIHHEFPKDKDRLAMPPLMSTAIGIVLLLISKWIIGDWAYSFMAGFLISYSNYLLIHYLVHAYQPPNNIFKFLWINHSIHHYKNGEGVYGVSSPLWDVVYGTMEKKKQNLQRSISKPVNNLPHASL